MDSKKRSKYSALAQKIKPVFQIGKNGVNDVIIKEIDDVLEARELIKINVLKTNDVDPKKVLDELSSKLGADPINCVGQKIVLYRKSKKKKERD